MIFVLSKASEGHLLGVHQDLARVIREAAKISTTQFLVVEGLRSRSRQEEMVRLGASKTMNSRHINGYAVDIAALVGGSPRWEWPLYYPLAETIKTAACKLSVPIVWGGVWDRVLNDIEDAETESERYIERRKLLGKKAFLDGPHFELSRTAYP